MVRQAENGLMTGIEGEAPRGRLMRENYWIPFALSSRLDPGDGPRPVRLFGENYVAFRAEDGRIGFLDERRSGARRQRRVAHLHHTTRRLCHDRRRAACQGEVHGQLFRECAEGHPLGLLSVARSPISGASPMTTPNQRSRSLTTRNIFSSWVPPRYGS